MGIAGLGAVAGGFADGIERGQRIDANNMRIQRERKQMQREDDEMAALDAANAAARDVLKRYEGDWKKQQPGPTLDGAPVQSNPFKPSPLMILEAGSARTNKLLELKGPTQAWGQSWAQDEAMRSRVRGDAAQRVRQAMTMGGDLTEPLSEFYSTTIGAGKVTQAGMSRGPDGKPVVSIALEGQPQPLVLPAEQFLAEMEKTAANPADIAKHNLQMTLEAFKQQGTREEIGQRGEEARKTEGVKASYGLADNADKARLKLGEIGARTLGDIKVKQTPGAAPAEPNEITLGEGQTRVRKGKDGTYSPVATGSPKTATSKVDWTGLVAKHYGEPKMGMLGESRMPGPDTMALSISAQEIYEANKDRPGMTPEKAIELAARQHKAVTPGSK